MEDEKPPSTTTTSPSIPAIDPLPPAKSHPPSPPRHPTTLQNLSFLILQNLSTLAYRLDRNLHRLAQLLASPTSTDALLCTLTYTLELVHALLSRLLQRRLTSIAADIAEKANDVLLLPGETVVATLPAPHSTRILAQVAGSSKVLAGMVADFRVFVRLWGVVGLYVWAKTAWSTPLMDGREEGKGRERDRDRVLRRVMWAQIASCMLFQILENGAYLSSKGVLTSSAWAGEAGRVRESRWWVWSSRWWAVHVGLEGVRLYTLWRYRNRDLRGSEGREMEDDGEKEGKLLKGRRRRENQLWWRDLVSTIAYCPLTLHWSVEEGLLSDIGVGACGMVAGGVLLVDAWGQTA